MRALSAIVHSGAGALGLGILLAAAGCRTAGPDYAPPDRAGPSNWTVRADTTAPAALAAWWEVFDDAVLTSLMVEAQRGNLDLRQAAARLRQARAQRDLARAERLPSVSAAASAGRVRGSEQAGSGRSVTSWSAGLDASWELDLFGGKQRAAEAAEAALQASLEELRDVRVSLLAEVALNYIDYRAAQLRLALTETHLASQAETHDIVCWRQQANLTTQLDVDQSRMSLEQTRAELPLLRSAAAQAEHQLCTLLGLHPGKLRARLNAGDPVIPAANRELAIGVPADVLRQRPDVRAAERRLAAQTAQIGVAAASRYPDFTLSGSIGLEALTFGDLFTTAARTAQGLARAGWTVFDAGRSRARVGVETALQEQTLAAYEAAILTALQDVENALSAAANDRTRQQALQAAESAGLSALRLARDRYAAGLVDFPTVLDAQRSLFTVQGSLASCRADVTIDLVRLYKAVGGGWTPEAEEGVVPPQAPQQQETPR